MGNQGGEIDGPFYANDTLYSISRDLGTIRATEAPVVWAVGYVMDPAFNYQVKYGSSMNTCSPYYKLEYADDENLVT